MTVRTPRVCNSEIREIESVLGGSLSAISPITRAPAGIPAATASTLKPCFSSSSTIAAAAGDGAVRATTAANAPLMIRSAPTLASVTVASDVFLAGSKGRNVASFGRSDAGLCEAAARIA